jgi:putative glutamine amidotransferase
MSAALMHPDPERPIFKGKELQFMEGDMLASVWRNGGLPVGLVDVRSKDALREQIGQSDGLLLQGGSDVAPQSYEEEPLRPEWSGDPIRDRFELESFEIAIELGKPVLGICRGIQVINVALGGDLLQDIGTQHPDALVHRDHARYDKLAHACRVETGSWIHDIYERENLEINSVHHQAVKTVAADLRATAWAPDGIVEAAERIDRERWIVGVQWHPEWSHHGGPDLAPGDRIFDAFMDVCRERA